MTQPAPIQPLPPNPLRRTGVFVLFHLDSRPWSILQQVLAFGIEDFLFYPESQSSSLWNWALSLSGMLIAC